MGKGRISYFTKNVLLFSLISIIISSGFSTVLPALADPPVPDPNEVILPKVFCLRIMDIIEVSSGVFDIEFEVLNWTNTPIHKIEFDIANPNLGNVLFAATSIDASDRPLRWVDADTDASFPPGDLGDFEDVNNNGVLDGGEDLNANGRIDNSPAPGNLTPVNNWTTGTLTATEAVFDAGTPIPPIDLLSATTTAGANALLPGSPTIDATGVIEDPEDIDNGINVLGGFVLRVTDFDPGETFTMNWMTFDSSGNLIGTSAGGNAFGFGSLQLALLATPGSLPGSVFAGFPPIAQSPRDFYGGVFNVISTAGTIPAFVQNGSGDIALIVGGQEVGTNFAPNRNSFAQGTGCIDCIDQPPRDFNLVPPEFFLDGHWYMYNADCTGSPGCAQHGEATRPFAEGNRGMHRHYDNGFECQYFNFDVFEPTHTGSCEQTGPNTGTFSYDSLVGGPFGGDQFFDGTIGLDGSPGTGTLTLNQLPPPGTEITWNMNVKGVPILTTAETMPNQIAGLNPGDVWIIRYSQDTDQATVTNFNTQYEVYRADNDTLVNMGPGTGTGEWTDARTFMWTWGDLTGTGFTGNSSDHYIVHAFTNTMRSADNMVPVSQVFGTGRIAGPDIGPPKDCIFNQTGPTMLDKNCRIFEPSFSGGDIVLGSNVLVEIFSGGIMCADLGTNGIFVPNTSGINVKMSGAIKSVPLFGSCN